MRQDIRNWNSNVWIWLLNALCVTLSGIYSCVAFGIQLGAYVQYCFVVSEASVLFQPSCEYFKLQHAVLCVLLRGHTSPSLPGLVSHCHSVCSATGVTTLSSSCETLRRSDSTESEDAEAAVSQRSLAACVCPAAEPLVPIYSSEAMSWMESWGLQGGTMRDWRWDKMPIQERTARTRLARDRWGGRGDGPSEGGRLGRGSRQSTRAGDTKVTRGSMIWDYLRGGGGGGEERRGGATLFFYSFALTHFFFVKQEMVE